MFDRVEKLIGKYNFELLKQKTVLLVGLGGVGGSALETLVRSGIHNIIIVDFDYVDITNLNRQVITNSNNIGIKKTLAAYDFCLNINPNCNITVIDSFLNSNNIGEVLDNNKIDYIIDACDTINTKKTLILEALKKNVKIISCMGTGNKLDPTKLEITDIRKTINDPIARIMRKWVKDNRINSKIMVVSSVETPLKKDKVISTMSFVPNSAGILLANYVIRDIINI